jgi:hypothetical protein
MKDMAKVIDALRGAATAKGLAVAATRPYDRAGAGRNDAEARK